MSEMIVKRWWRCEFRIFMWSM